MTEKLGLLGKKWVDDSNHVRDYLNSTCKGFKYPLKVYESNEASGVRYSTQYDTEALFKNAMTDDLPVGSKPIRLHAVKAGHGSTGYDAEGTFVEFKTQRMSSDYYYNVSDIIWD